MRLFIALNFDEDNKDILASISRDLAGIALRGSPVLRQNYHITLAFIGESTDIRTLSRCMDQAAGPAFSLTTAKLGSFHGKGGDILWLSLAPEPQLTALQMRLAAGLKAQGFTLDRAFRPHITLMREAVLPESFDFCAYTKRMPKLSQNMRRISLMKSERLNGRLLYSEIYAQTLFLEHGQKS